MFDHIKDEREREQKKRERDRDLEEVMKRKERLSSQQPVPLPPVDLSGLRIRRGQLEFRLSEWSRRGQELIGQNAALFQSYQALQAEGLALRDRILDRYSTLTADPEVKAALRDLNKGRSASQWYFVGPSGNLPDLPNGLKQTALEILRSYGLVLNRGHLRYAPGVEADVTKRIKAVV